MNIVIVDNNPNDLAQLGTMVAEILPKWQIQPFTDPLLSAKYICNTYVNEAEALAAEVNGFFANPISTERLSSVIHRVLL